MRQEEERHLGFGSMLLLGVNGIIGSGIFLLPGTLMNLTGHWSLVVYIVVTFIVLSIAWCFAQCAALFQRNGGAYVYAKEAFGDFIGFEIGIMRWVVGILAWATVIVGFITALSSVWPLALQEPVRSVLILGIVGGLGLLNIIGIRVFKHVNNLVTIAKLFSLLLFVGLGFFFVKINHYSPSLWQDWEPESFGTAALVVFYAFGGFESLVVAAGEMKNPSKNLPLAIMLIMTFCSFLYFVIQLITIGIMGDALAESLTPLADAAQILVGDFGRWFVTLAMLISIGGINLSSSFITPRSGVALAEDGLIPRKIAEKGRFGTPSWAILLTMGLTSLFALSGSFTHLAVISVIARFVQYISTCLAVLVLYRHKYPTMKPYQQALFTIIPGCALVGVGWLMLQATPLQLIWGLGTLVLGIPIYRLQQIQQTSREPSNT